ncbi:SDR family oxidoreductase [Steroidobacter flavus]|uniref:SDR family oxidoreductase n=1 Tax=Steroidobacter flavus TaxID=1842136 RepID=A0ABV8SZF9_9GAMM
MSNDEGKTKGALTQYAGSRRRFLQRAVFSAAGASAAAGLLNLSEAETRQGLEDTAAAECPDVKVPMKDVAGKVAFITGGSSGIGLGIARAFLDAGMKVAIGYRTTSHLQEAMKFLAVAGDRVHAVKVDVTDRKQMEQAAAETVKVFGKVHVLANNAGVVTMPTLVDTDYEDWNLVMNVNVDGAFNGLRAFLPHIRAHGEGGQIIATASLGGLWVTIPVHGAYYVSKFALIGMMEALRVELAGTNIGVSIYCAGPVKTGLKDASVDPGKADDIRKRDTFRTAGLDGSQIALDKLEAGRFVLRGMRNNDLYILTSPEFKENIRERNEALLAALPQDVHPNETQVEWAKRMRRDSIYGVELQRSRCARSAHAKSVK